MSLVGKLRMVSQHITPPAPAAFTRPVDVVRHMLAMQGQDFASLLWAIGLRAPGSTLADVEAAFASGQIVRGWPMRGTLHATAAEDLPWMVDLLCPRIVESVSARRRAQLDLDDKTLARARSIAEKALSGGRHETRDDLLAIFRAKGIATDGQRGYHILFHLSATKTLCFGPPKTRAGKTAGTVREQTFVLLEEWIPKPRALDRDDALGELARRYFQSHGPATVADFTAWTKLTAKDVKRALDIAKDYLEPLSSEGISYFVTRAPTPKASRAPALAVVLLPAFDEFLLGYRDRTAVLSAEHAQKIVPGGNGIFLPTIVKDGQVIGTWRRAVRRKNGAGADAEIEPLPFDEVQGFHARARKEIAQATLSYRRFMGHDAQ